MESTQLLKAGIAASKAGDDATAVAIFSRVVQADPNSSEGWFWLGMSMPSSDKKIYCFRRVLKIEPNHFEARGQLELLGYLKPPPSPPPKESPSIFEPVPASSSSPVEETASSSLFSDEPKNAAFQDYETYYEEEPEPKKESPPRVEEPAFMADVETDVDEDENKKTVKPKAKKKNKKGQKIILAVLGGFALLAIIGVIALFLLQPDLLAGLTHEIL